MSGGGHEDRREDEVVRIFGIQCERLLRILVALDEIAFGIPVNRQIAIGEREWIFRD